MSTAATSPGEGAGTAAPARVRDVVRDVVAEIAAEELPVVDGLAALDDATALRHLTDRSHRREPLGFGWENLVVLVTPVVWLVVDEAAKRAAGSVVDAGVKWSKSLWRKGSRRKAEELAVPPLNADQLDQVRLRVLEEAERQGLPADRAEELAAKLVDRLGRIGLEPPRAPEDEADPPAGS
ncbi:hypothetical protein [Actinosynnema sp. NPDC020468]|uniref:hypothetical protein n=1 Tax=Actinosynnema sp. NPDC020468 TaxID=3154488 RepID=UPI0033E73261